MRKLSAAYKGGRFVPLEAKRAQCLFMPEREGVNSTRARNAGDTRHSRCSGYESRPQYSYLLEIWSVDLARTKQVNWLNEDEDDFS